ncbi:MAG: LacI-family transcriptional regulator [Alphaproteobacteria bacterium]|jgi:LacI family transcriptional regulator|nr:LacI-family transcriptional regulator [Alphaproteobacteria bacterium]MDB5740461.1 LacI-family transcriptional regulator [Alphaproteobacteria bacterium]
MIKKTGRKSGSVVTIHDVAKHAGVSPMTVSRVINSEPNVREETRLKVAASVKALRYSPNLAARSLASADAMHLGILYSNPSAAYLSEFLLGSLEESSLSGSQLVIEQCERIETEREAIARLVRGGIDGVILPAPLCDSEEALKAVEEAGIPAVLVASGRPAAGLSAVSINDFEASRAMTRHLLSLGHKRIGFINGHPNQTASGQRFRGYIEGMTEAGLSVGTDQVAQGYFTYRSGMEAAERLFSNYDPTAIFASNDDMAAATVAVAHRKGLEVPGDVAIAGFDDTPLATTVWPELTTVRQPIADMAREAVRLLIEQIKGRRAGKPAQVVHKSLKFTLIKRESTAAPPSGRKARSGPAKS